MSHTELVNRINKAEQELYQSIKDLASLRKEMPEEAIKDYSLECTQTGKSLYLSQIFNLFKNKEELIVIHNMGVKCPGCTAWADGFSGIVHHLESRAGFIVSTPDPIETQQKVKKLRGWNFNMVSAKDSSFTKDMGFTAEDHGFGPYRPGISTFKKDASGSIFRVGRANICPDDIYFPAFHLFDLLPKGRKDWFPKFNYENKKESACH